MTANILDFFKKAGSVLYDDPTVQAYCGALQEAYHNAKTGLYKENDKCLIYDFDAIADLIWAGGLSLLPDMLCYYKCDDYLSNTKVVDIINGHDGVSNRNTRAFSTIDGAIGRGFDFDAAEPDFITISKSLPDGNTIDLNAEWSFRVIVNPDTYSSGTILSNRVSTSDYGMHLDVISGGQFVLWLRALGINKYLQSPTGYSGDVEIVLTCDGTGDHSAVKMYTNTTVSSTWGGAGTPTTIAQGDFILGNDTRSATPYDGMLDEVGIWPIEISSTQVTSMYNSGAFATYSPKYEILLDYLAWQFRVYLWDRSQDPTTKLNLLKQSLKFRGKIGTPWAVKQAIELVANPDNSDFVTNPIVITEGTGGAFYNGAYDFDGTINFDSDYSPFKFDVTIPQTTTPSTTDQALFLKAIDSYKNARSWLNAVTYPGSHFGGNAELIAAIANGAYFALEDNAATTNVVDSTGNFTATASSNTSVFHSASGFENSCFDFSGGTTDNFSCDFDGGTPGSVLAHDKGLAFGFWFYNPGTTGFKGLIGNTASSGYPGFYVYLNGTTNINVVFRQGSGQYRNAYNNNLVAGWNYCYVGQDSSNTHGGITLDLNGASKTFSSQTGPALTDISSANPVYFGYTLISGGFTERMDEIAFLPVNPTTTMSSALYNSGAGLFY